MTIRQRRPAPRLPDFIIIGTQKGGTTALHHYLARHPQVAVATRKELNFFIDPGLIPTAPDGPPRGDWHRGIDWYRSWFETGRKVCGEASPNYSVPPYVAPAAARMAAVVPGARIIYLVRQPLERMRSQYRMAMKRPGTALIDFAEFVRSTTTLGISGYGSILRRYLDHFPRDRILVVESAALADRRRETLAEVFRFLEVDPSFWCDWYERTVFDGARSPFLSPRGKRLRDSTPMRWLRRSLSDRVAFHVDNLILSPFAVPPPPTELPPTLLEDVIDRLREETALLRRLTGQPLESLDLPPL